MQIRPYIKLSGILALVAGVLVIGLAAFLPRLLDAAAELSGAELSEKTKQLTQELFNLRFQLGTGRLENPMQIRKTKRSIAQVKTVLREVEQAGRKKAS